MPDWVVAVTLIHGIAGRRQELCELMRRTEERVAEEPGCCDSSTKSGEASCRGVAGQQ